MSSCLSGAGGGTYGFDFEFMKPSSSSSTRTSHNSSSSSPSSTISESSNSQLAISTRKTRTPRKRPNQTYNEAAALLSTAYPNLFSTKDLTKPFPKNGNSKAASFFNESTELLLPFRVFDDGSSFLLHNQLHRRELPTVFSAEPKMGSVHQEKLCQSPGEISSRVKSLELEDHCEDDFDAESMLDEEIDEGIDSIMGSGVELDSSDNGGAHNNPWTSYGGKLDFRLGLRRAGVRALRHAEDCNWWNFPVVDILQISPKIEYKPAQPVATAEKEKKMKKKKVEKVEKQNVESAKNKGELPKGNSTSPTKSNSAGLMLKLNYDGVRNAWSDKGSPFADDSPAAYTLARLSQIDLVWDNGGGGGGGVREASMLRYKDKRRTRLFSNKVNADRRPRSMQSSPKGPSPTTQDPFQSSSLVLFTPLPQLQTETATSFWPPPSVPPHRHRAFVRDSSATEGQH